MRSATSCFNKTIIRTDVKRFWPLLFLYTAIWTVMLPVYQWVDLGFPYSDYPGDYLYDMMFGGVIMGLIFGGLFAMASFSYLMNSRSVGLMHSLPVSRSAQFFSHVAAVMGMLTAGKLIVAVLTVLVQLMHGDVAFKAIGVWLLVVTLVEFFFFSLGTLCSMVTGWLLAMPVLYAVANALAIMVTQLLRFLGELFYFGYANANSYPAVTYWLTPVYQMGEVLMDHVRETMEVVVDTVHPGGAMVVPEALVDYPRGPRVLSPEAPGVLAVYTAAAVVMLVISYFLYRRRASESAGDPVAFGWARPIFRYGVALCGGLALGLGLYSILSMNSDTVGLALLIVCMVLMGVLCYFAVEMVIRKSFRVFGKGWPGAVAVGVVLTAVCIGASMDITGYESRLPDEDKIESAEINIYREDIYVNECVEPETIAAVLALHEAIVADGELPTGDDGYYNVNLEYAMADGSRFVRHYTLSMPKAMKSAQIVGALDTLINCEEVRYQVTLNSSKEFAEGLKLRGGYITGKYIDHNQQLSAADADRIRDAVLADLANGAGKQEPLNVEGWPECTVYIELEGSERNLWLDRIRPDFTETVDVLNELGLDSATLFQVDEKYAEKYGW
ncbi:MAG: hypothetical protein E7469_07240 [Ruminococcaceae bacterium]|nr:hypothetical protein [Oscillospiraceae bacterium]